MTEKNVLRSFIKHSILSQLIPSINFRIRHDKAVPRLQFFHNLPTINFRMRHDRERKDMLGSYIQDSILSQLTCGYYFRYDKERKDV